MGNEVKILYCFCVILAMQTVCTDNRICNTIDYNDLELLLRK